MTPDQKNLAYYCTSFASLPKGKKYQPILLLAVIDLISQDIITENKIHISDDLINTFRKYRKILNPDSKGDLNYPFGKLRKSNFWHLQLRPNVELYEDFCKTMGKLKKNVEYASVDDELFKLIQEPDSRSQLVETLLSVWFSSSQKQIQEVLEINKNFQAQEIIESGNINLGEARFYLRKSLIRNAFFRKSIVYVYNHRCALCRLKVITSFEQSIVDGAHIKPFSKFYDNNIDNGISLCKNHHWAFDQGLFTIDDDYRVLVYDNFKEESPNARPLKDFSGELIILPNSQTYYPRLEAIQWHRTNIFGNQSSS